MPYYVDSGGEIYPGEIKPDGSVSPAPGSTPITETADLRIALKELVRDYNDKKIWTAGGDLDPANPDDRKFFIKHVSKAWQQVFGDTAIPFDQENQFIVFPGNEEIRSKPEPAHEATAGTDVPPVPPVETEEEDDTFGQGSASAPSQSGGDPVLLANGQLHHQVVDLSVPGRGIKFSFTRTYRSQPLYKGPFGFNWDHSYNLWLREVQERRDGALRNVAYRSTGTVREDAYIQEVDQPMGSLEPLDDWTDATFRSPPGYFDRLEKTDDRYVLETPDGITYYYQDYGTVYYAERIEDPNGNTIELDYSTDPVLLTQVTDAVGKQFEFTYDSMNRISQLIDVEGQRRINYSYTENGDLEEVDKHLNDRVTSTDYRYSDTNVPPDRQHNLQEIINALGETILETEYGDDSSEWGYNAVVRQRSESGAFHYEYDSLEDTATDPALDPHNVARHETTVHYPNGHAIEHIFNEQGNVVRREEQAEMATDPLVATYRYNEDGLLVQQVLADGSKTEYRYGRDAYIETHGSVESASPADRLTFGSLLRTVRYPQPGTSESRRIVTDYHYTDYADARGVRLEAVRGPYYADVQLTELPDQPVGTTTFQYDATGNIEVVDPPDVERPDGTTITDNAVQYEYDSSHWRLTGMNSGDRHVEFEYFSDQKRSGFVKRTIRDPGGSAITTETEVDTHGRVTGIVGPYGEQTNIEWTAFDAPQTVTLPRVAEGQSRPTVQFEYGRNLQLRRRERELQHSDGTSHPETALVETQHYDRYGRLIGEEQAAKTGTNSRMRRVVYNPSGLIEREVNWGGTTDRIQYNDRLLPAQIVRSWGTSHETTQKLRYDRGGRLKELVDERDQVTTFEYDAFGRLRSVTDPDGNEQRFEYDAAGRTITTQIHGPPPGGGASVRWSETNYERDAVGQIIRKTDALFNPPQPSGGDRLLHTYYIYDEHGDLQRIVDPTGAELQQEYDSLGRLTRTVTPDGNEVTYEYDDQDRRIDIVETTTGEGPDGTPKTHVTHQSIHLDKQQRPVEIMDPNGNSFTTSYDSRGYPHVVSGPAPDPIKRITETDAFGRVTTISEGTQSTSAETEFDYGPSDELLGIEDPVGNRTKFEYDPLGRCTKVLQGGAERTFQYDSGSLCTEVIDENGVTFNRRFSNAGRLLEVTPDISGFSAPPGRSGYVPASTGAVRFSYTPAGQIAQAENDVATVVREYDSLNRLQEEDIDGRTTAFEYDDAHRLSELTYPTGRQVQYDYTTEGHLRAVTQTQIGSDYPGDIGRSTPRSLLETKRVGKQVTSVDYGSISTQFSYDRRKLPVGANWIGSDGTTIFQERRLYGPRGECTLAQLNNQLDRMSYDDLGREVNVERRDYGSLIDVSELSPASSVAGVQPGGQAEEDSLDPGSVGTLRRRFEYDLDANTNRRRVSVTGDTGQTNHTDYAVGSFNRYNYVGPTQLEYDRAGNLLSDGSREFVYDAYSRLATATVNGQTTEFQWDAFGRIIERTSAGTTRQLSYADVQPIEWRHGGTQSDVQLAPTPNGYCHAAADGSEFVPIQDLTGTIQGWADQLGQRSSERTYAPFGAVDSQSGQWPAPIGFHGHMEDQQSRMNVLPARTYHPELGRFLQPDPADFADGPNLYAYANHAPAHVTDRWGLAASEINWGEAGSQFDAKDIGNAAMGIGNLESTEPSEASKLGSIGSTTTKFGLLASRAGSDAGQTTTIFYTGAREAAEQMVRLGGGRYRSLETIKLLGVRATAVPEYFDKAVRNLTGKARWADKALRAAVWKPISAVYAFHAGAGGHKSLTLFPKLSIPLRNPSIMATIERPLYRLGQRSIGFLKGLGRRLPLIGGVLSGAALVHNLHTGNQFEAVGDILGVGAAGAALAGATPVAAVLGVGAASWTAGLMIGDWIDRAFKPGSGAAGEWYYDTFLR